MLSPGTFGGVKPSTRTWLVAILIALAATGLVAAMFTFARPAAPPPPVDSAQLREAITQDALVGHLNALQGIADANGGNRAAGTPGYAGSIDYVEGELRKAGYQTQRQQFSYTRPDFTKASLRRTAPTQTDYVVGRDHRPLEFSGSGSVTAAVTAVDLKLDGDQTNTSACEASDFANFPRGTIALVQRGTCQFNQKVEHAVAAGAGGVIVLNQGNGEGRRGLFTGTLGRSANVPVVATTFDLGTEWARPGTTLALSVESTVATISTENLIADTAAGTNGRTFTLGAHLDSVSDGPGMNDNASGVAAVLEIAVQFARLQPQQTTRVRFVFWGGEEDGLLGSRHYVGQLGEAERKSISGYLNLDMIGSPKPAPAVYGRIGWPAGSSTIQSLLTEALTSQGVTPGVTGMRSSDHAPFLDAGIPVGGLFTGADDATDPCYHQVCDRLQGLDRTMLEKMADAAAHATLSYAQAP